MRMLMNAYLKWWKYFETICCNEQYTHEKYENYPILIASRINKSFVSNAECHAAYLWARDRFSSKSLNNHIDETGPEPIPCRI